jgi:peptidoglycan biosynthesis protein MviN/MurJ (putative lipid II flippase)
MRSTILLTILTPVLSLSLVQRFGAAGVAVGTSMALTISAIYLLVAFHRNYLETSVVSMVRETYVRPLGAALFAVFAVLVLHHAFPGVGAMSEVRYLILIKLFLDFAIFSPIYVIFLVVVRQVTPIDRRNFLDLMNFGFEFVRHPFREWVKIYR